MDDTLRALERRWRETGADGDAARLAAARERAGTAELRLTWACAPGGEAAEALLLVARELYAALDPATELEAWPDWKHYGEGPTDWTREWWHLRKTTLGGGARGLRVEEQSQSAHDGEFCATRIVAHGLPGVTLSLVADSRDGQVRLEVTGSRDDVRAVEARVERSARRLQA